MDDGGTVGGGRLARADVHAPVDLHRVDGDDLGARRRRGRPPSRRPTCPPPSGRARTTGRHYVASTGMRTCAPARPAPPQGAGQVVRCGAGDLHVGVRAWSQRARRPEVDEAVLARCGPPRRPGPSCSAPRRAPPPTDRRGLRWRPALTARRRRAGGRTGAPATSGCDEAVGQLGGLRARARGEDERVGVVEAGLGGDLERGGEVVLGLPREADDDVGGDGEVRDDPPGLGQPVEVALRRVAAVHRGQHAVGAGLQRVVEVRAHRRRLGHRGERLGAHVLGVRRREAHTADPVDGTDLPQQVGEQRADPRGSRRRRGGPPAGGRARSC